MDIYVLNAHCSHANFYLFATKVDGPYSVTILIKSTIIEWYVVWCGSKNGCQKSFVWKELDCMLKIW